MITKRKKKLKMKWDWCSPFFSMLGILLLLLGCKLRDLGVEIGIQ